MGNKKKRGSGAVAKAWAIFNRHPKVERQVALAACAKAGINPNTAKTQWQLWTHASKAERTAKGGRFAWRPGDLKSTGGGKQTPPAASTGHA